MRKIHKVLDIPNISIHTINKTPVAIEIANIKHAPVHYHEHFMEMVMCIKGSVNILCNHEIITLKEGEMFTVSFDDLHCIYSDEDNITVSFYLDMFNMDVPWETLRHTYLACEDRTCQAHQFLPLQRIKDFILAALYTYVTTGTISSEEAITASHGILNILIEHFDWFNSINLAPNAYDELRQRFRSIIEYCTTNINSKLTISQLASAVHINENYFSQFLRKSGYGSFSNLMGYIRCYKAQFMLLNTTMSVIQISDKCGFSDVKYFYKHFKSVWQKTPSQFRKWFQDYITESDYVCTYDSDDIIAIVQAYVAESFSRNMLSHKLH